MDVNVTACAQLRQDIGHILLVISENHKALSNIVAVLMSLQDEVNSLRDTLRRQQATSFVIQPPSASTGTAHAPQASAPAHAAPAAAHATTLAPSHAAATGPAHAVSTPAHAAPVPAAPSSSGFVAALTRKRSHELRPTTESTSSSTDRTSRKSSKTSQ